MTRRHGKGRARSPGYELWIKTAGWEVRAQRPQRVAGPVEVEILAPFNRQRDLDNCKAVLDLAVTLDLIDDDRWVDKLTIIRKPKDAVMTVSIWPMADHGTVIAPG